MALALLAPPASALGVGEPVFSIRGVGGVGASAHLTYDEARGASVGFCWWFTSDSEWPPGPQPYGGGYIVTFPFVNYAPLVRAITHEVGLASANQTEEPAPPAERQAEERDGGAPVRAEGRGLPRNIATPPSPADIQGIGTQHAGTAPSCHDSLL